MVVLTAFSECFPKYTATMKIAKLHNHSTANSIWIFVIDISPNYPILTQQFIQHQHYTPQ